MARRSAYALLFLGLIFGSACLTLVTADQAEDEKLKAALADAEEAQDFREEAQDEVKAKVIEEAPGATLASGTGDVSTTGDCAGDIDDFCMEVKPGEGRISECLTKQLEEENKGNVEGKKLTDACKKEMEEFKIDRGTNVNKNLPLAEACKADSKKLCSASNPTDPGAVLACLRDEKENLSAQCKDEIFKTQLEGAQDYRTDADLHLACESDSKKICKDVKPGEGRIQDCLRDHSGQVSFECQEELFRQEVENADDIRLSQRLVKKCMAEKKKFCNDVKPGNARVKDCLEDHRDEPGFSAECKEEFELMMEARAADFRLDSSLREKCADDIEDVCGVAKDSMESVEGYDARVIECLQDFKDELVQPECKAQVHKLTSRASQDIRFDEPLADACFEDRSRLCEEVQPGSARVIRCLQEQREELGWECKATLFDAEVRMAEDIDFKFPMKRACTNELNQLCPGIQHGSARLIRCLQEHMDDDIMSAECKIEVERDQIRSNQDYRLNFRLTDKCEDDIETLCGDACNIYTNQACGGRVLRCLTDKQEQVKSKECQEEIFYFEKMEVNDFRNDVLLAEACRTDVETHCKNVKPGEGRVHQCLRDKMDKLSEGCRTEELKLNIIQSRDIRLRPKLNKLCSEEIVVFCKDIQPGKGRVFKCLQENLAQPDFGAACKAEVEERGLSMQENYKLDFGVSSACEPDVQAVCSAEKGKAHGHAEVLKCLVRNYKGLNETCQTEMSRAVRMALWEYRKGMALTGVCDADVDQVCQKASNQAQNKGIWSIGAVGRCLSRQLAERKTLTSQCQTLVAVAAPKDAQTMFDKSMTSAAIAQRITEMQRAAGITTQLVNPYGRGTSFVTLTGWVAIMALLSLITVAVTSMVFGYRRWAGLDEEHEVSTKEGDV